MDFLHCQILDPVGDAVAFPKSYGILERPAHRSGTDRLTRTSFLSAGSIGSEFVIVSLGQTCMIDRRFDSRMQLNVQLLSEGPSRNSTIEDRGRRDVHDRRRPQRY